MTMSTRALCSAFRVSRRQIHIRRWKLSSTPQGSLRITVPFACNLNISPLDPHQSEWTQTNVQLHIPTSASLSEGEARNITNKLVIHAREESDDKRSAHIEASAVQCDREIEKLLLTHVPELRVEIPGLQNVWIELSHGSIRLRDTIEGDVRIVSDSADVFVNKLRSTSAKIETKEGNVEARILQGNVNIESQIGTVKLTRAQGNDIKVQCGGPLEAGSLYGGRLTVRSGGAFSADAVHGDADIEADGAVISAVQGSLRLKSNNSASITLADTGTELIDIDAEGDVHLGVSKGLAASFDLDAGNVHDEVAVLRKESGVGGDGTVCSVRVRATGNVTLRDGRWAERMLGLASARH